MLLGLWAALSVACGLVLIFGGARPAAKAGPWGSAAQRIRRAAEWLRARVAPLPREAVWLKLLWVGPGVAFLALAAYLSWGLAGGELDAFTEAYVPPRVYRAATAIVPPVGDETVARLPWNRSLDQALAISSRIGKPIFIDFTGYTCVNCRWMEKRVFAKSAVLETLRNRFVLVQLYTDGGPDGDKNQRLQVERFRTLALPFYVILAPDNAVLATHTGVLPSIPGFLDFLARGERVAAPDAPKVAAKLAPAPDPLPAKPRRG
jgi:thiol:disulfide interchange protein